MPAAARSHRAGRSRWAAAAVVAAVAVTTGCGTGMGNETQKEKPAVQATSVSVGTVSIHDVYITPVGNPVPAEAVTTIAGSATAIATPSPQTTPTPPPPGAADGYLVATVVNTSSTTPDQVVSASVGDAASGSAANVLLAPPNARLTVPPLGVLQIHDPAATRHGPFLVLTGLRQPLVIGTTVPVTFTLAGIGQTPVIQAPVITSFAGPPPATPPVPTTVATRVPAATARAHTSPTH